MRYNRQTGGLKKENVNSPEFMDNNIVALRVVALCSVIACHILAVMGSQWGQVFNIGVQVFFAISGYLYGLKDSELRGAIWFKKRIKKLYVPYVVFLSVLLAIYLAIGIDLEWQRVLKYYFLLDGFPIIATSIVGCGHLWFMSGLAVCYAVTPLLKQLKQHLSLAVLLLVMLVIDVSMVDGYFYYVFIYAIAYQLPKLTKKEAYLFGTFLLAGLLYSYVRWLKCADIMEPITWHLSHSCGGLVIIIVATKVLAPVQIVGKCIAYLSDRSYYMYLVHMPLVNSPLSILGLTQCTAVNYVVLTLSIILSSEILFRTSRAIVEAVK